MVDKPEKIVLTIIRLCRDVTIYDLEQMNQVLMTRVFFCENKQRFAVLEGRFVEEEISRDLEFINFELQTVYNFKKLSPPYSKEEIKNFIIRFNERRVIDESDDL